MFGKLLKHELRHTARYHFAILTASLIATVVMGLSLIFKADTVLSMAMFPLVIVAFAVIIVSLTSVIKNFYETIYSRQGYLTLTLPVKCNQLLISKVLISFFWIIVSYIAAFLPFVFILIHIKKQLDADNMTDELVQTFTEFLPSGGSMAVIVVFFVITSLISILSYVGYVYFSVTAANTRLLSKHPKLFGVLVFMAIHFIVGAVTDLTADVLPLNFIITTDSAFFSFKDALELGREYMIVNLYSVNSYIVEALASIGLLFTTGYIMEHKINIK